MIRELLLLLVIIIIPICHPRTLGDGNNESNHDDQQNKVSCPDDEKQLIEFLAKTYEVEASIQHRDTELAKFEYETNITQENAEKLSRAEQKLASFNKNYHENCFKKLNPDKYADINLKRHIRKLKIVGEGALEEKDLLELSAAKSEMTRIYNSAKVCPYQKQKCDVSKEGFDLEPDITKTFASSRDYDELLYLWTAWRNETGKLIQPYFEKYLGLSNKMAVGNGFDNTTLLWQNDYETENFEAVIDKLWKEVEPLYNELHTYVKNRLKGFYGSKIDVSDGKIPAHLLGNMWAQSWVDLEDLLIPFPDVSRMNVTDALLRENFTVKRMFETSDDFYKSLGLESNEMSYGPKAMIERPEGRKVVCHASAWDFFDGKDYRIKMCTSVNERDFIVIHHEMGHIQYFILYKNQLISFRQGANPGFHEAIGDTISLSVATPKHMKKIGLLTGYKENYESDINELMNMALKKIAVLPFTLVVEKWRWDVFAGKVQKKDWNSHWWKYRQEIQKVKPPLERTAEDFDPGAKYHIPGNAQYISYFISHILQFQLYKGMCTAAGETGPLHRCDFYQNKKAGENLRKGLELGSSEHWTVVLKKITGEDNLSAKALLEYFQPLYDFLKRENAKVDLNVESDLRKFLNETYEPQASSQNNNQMNASWNYATDINAVNANKLVEATQKQANFTKEFYQKYFKSLNESNYKDVTIKRQVKLLRKLGDSILGEADLNNLTVTKNLMNQIYSTAKICPYKKQNCNLEKEGLNLDPDITLALAKSRDYDEQLYIWKEWRVQSGRKIRPPFEKYAELSNKAAKLNGFTNKGEMWQSDFETDNLVQVVDNLWKQVEPLYNELHKYVSRKLKKFYGNKIDVSDGKIPAHVFGNMWAQSWTNINDLVKPFSNVTSVNVTDALVQKKITVKQMFNISDEFYLSLGLERNDMSYGPKAMIEKPKDREVLCHASAWDFSDGKDFRIKMCTKVTYEDFVTIHHEMGHIQYYILYKNQPVKLRAGANPGFHEAVGDTIALSVATIKHLKKIGLLNQTHEESEASYINTLMDMALQRVAFLPFGLLIDKWRWDVFAGKIEKKDWNAHWWKYREQYQKIKAPTNRTQNDFDPGAKFHVASGSQYISYFIAHILEFQFYRSLCVAAGEYQPNNPAKPLHKCDFYNSKEAGNKLRKGLSLGTSKHWNDALYEITGERDLNASALLDYFKPLHDFLKKENQKPFIDKDEEGLLNKKPLLYGEYKTKKVYVKDDKHDLNKKPFLYDSDNRQLFQVKEEKKDYSNQKSLLYGEEKKEALQQMPLLYVTDDQTEFKMKMKDNSSQSFVNNEDERKELSYRKPLLYVKDGIRNVYIEVEKSDYSNRLPLLNGIDEEQLFHVKDEDKDYLNSKPLLYVEEKNQILHQLGQIESKDNGNRQFSNIQDEKHESLSKKPLLNEKDGIMNVYNNDDSNGYSNRLPLLYEKDEIKLFYIKDGRQDNLNQKPLLYGGEMQEMFDKMPLLYVEDGKTEQKNKAPQMEKDISRWQFLNVQDESKEVLYKKPLLYAEDETRKVYIKDERNDVYNKKPILYVEEKKGNLHQKQLLYDEGGNNELNGTHHGLLNEGVKVEDEEKKKSSEPKPHSFDDKEKNDTSHGDNERKNPINDGCYKTVNLFALITIALLYLV